MSLGPFESHVLLVQGGRWGTVEALQAHQLEAFSPFHKQADGAGSANFLPYMRARAVTVMGGVLPTEELADVWKLPLQGSARPRQPSSWWVSCEPYRATDLIRLGAMSTSSPEQRLPWKDCRGGIHCQALGGCLVVVCSSLAPLTWECGPPPGAFKRGRQPQLMCALCTNSPFWLPMSRFQGGLGSCG